MPDAPFPTTSAERHSPRISNRSWVYAIGGVIAGGCAAFGVYAGTGPASGLLIDMAWNRAASGNSSLAFHMQTGLSDTQILNGVSGEAFDSSSAGLKLADLTRATLKSTSELSPLAWDRLSAGDCISLTTESGQKLSFRIVGTRHAETSASASGRTPNIDLAITACAPSSDAVLKAVIESKPEGKQSAVQRSL